MTGRGSYSCDQTMERLNSYVDRELNDSEMAEVKKHLDDCPPCEQHFEFNLQVKRLVRTKGCPEKAPKALVDRILANFKRP